MIDAEIATEQPVAGETKRRGRPKKTPATPILNRESVPEPPPPDEEAPQFSTEPAEVLPFPPIQPKSNFDTLSNYWNNLLTPAQRRQGTVYLYRLNPKMLLVEGRGGRMVNANCEKFNEEDGAITRDLIRKRRRTGVYLLRLNQRVVKPSCEISNCEVEIHGDMTDPNDMPILDVENLDLDNEGNRDYVRLLRSRGILKAGDAEQQQGDEMAASQTLGNIAEKLITQRMDQPQQQPQQQPTGDSGIKEIVGLLGEQIRHNRPAEQQGTVLEHVEAIATLAKTLTPAQPDFGPFLQSIEKTNQMVLDLKEAEVKRAQADADRSQKEAQQFREALPKPKTVDEQFDELERAAERYKRMTGGKSEEDEEETKKNSSSMGGFLGTLAGSLPTIEKILGHAANIVFNWRLNGAGGPPLNPATNQPGTDPQPPEAAATPEQIEEQNHMQAIVNTLVSLERPMMSHFGFKDGAFIPQNHKSGAVFAKFVIDNYGPETFELIQNHGLENIGAMLKTYPPVWQPVTASGRAPQFIQFLSEFFSYQIGAVQ